MKIPTRSENLDVSVVTYRQGTQQDMQAVQYVFRASLYDLLYRMGMVDHPEVPQEDLERNWNTRKGLYKYLTDHAEHFWVAEREGEIIGYARTVQKGGVRELTEFFILPDTQSGGVGRELLARAFPQDAHTRNCIIATSDVRALARYMKSGVFPRFLIYELTRQAEAQPLDPNLEVQPLTLSSETLAMLADIDLQVVGHRRDSQHEWLHTERPGFLYRVNGDVIGYGYTGEDHGPFALRDPQYFPAVLAHAETETANQGREQFVIVLPTVNEVVLRYCLARGFMIDPFLMHFLSDQPFGQFDRYIMTYPALLM